MLRALSRSKKAQESAVEQDGRLVSQDLAGMTIGNLRQHGLV